jgi:tetratricopeptide (TPR) repeat protein
VNRRASLLAVVACAVLLYARTLAFPFSYLDDDELVLEDLEFLTQPTAAAAAFGRAYFPARGADHAYYRPLVTASFALDAARTGSGVSGYRVTNLCLHALVACLLWVVLESEGAAAGVALFATLAFVLHPALAAAVAWIPGRDDLLLALFALSTWLALLRSERQPQTLTFVAYGVAFFGALASKEAAVMLPLVFFGRGLVVRGRSFRAALSPGILVSSGLAFVVYGLLRLHALGPSLGLPAVHAGIPFDGLRSFVGGLGSLMVPSLPRVMAVPADVPLAPGVLAWLLAGYAVVAAPAETRPRLSFGLGWFVAFLLPSLPASARLILESRLYLPAAGVVLAVAEVARRMAMPASLRLAGASFVLVALAATTWRTLDGYSGRLAFAEMVAAGSPHSALAQRNLGVAHQLLGQVEPARRAYARALAADPDEPLVHNNLGVLYMAEGKLDDAERELRAELARHPGTPEALENLERTTRAR